MNLHEKVEFADRATPPCPHFGPCGGCQLQHLTYAAQLNLKAARLRTLLDATGLALPELQVHGSPPLAYRNRIRLTLAEVAGQLRAGYITSPAPDPSNLESRISNPDFLPITECPIAAPILWRATESLLALINQTPTLWLRNPQFQLDQLEPFTTGDESALQFTLYVRTAAKALPEKLNAAFTTLCEALRASIPELTGASIAILPLASANRSRRNEQPRSGPTWKSIGLSYAVAALETGTPNLEPGLTFWVPRGAFFQANRFLLPKLLALAAANRSGQLAFDLYAGVGLFSRALARSFAHVTAVEIAEPAASALASHQRNVASIDASERHRWLVQDAFDALERLALKSERFELIVLDPPRTGAGAEVCALLGRIAAPTLVYVSCSPETLPADLATLSASGYRVAELHLVDLFPQTNHIETVAVLIR